MNTLRASLATLGLLGVPVLLSAAEGLNDYRLSVNRSSLFSAPRSGGDHVYQYGPLSFDASLRYGYSWIYDMPYRLGLTEDVNLQTYGASASINVGDHWSLDYRPSWRRYSSTLFRDTFTQAALLDFNTIIGSTSVRLSQGYNRSDEVLLETGLQTRQDSYGTKLSVNRSFNQLFSADFEGSQALMFPESRSITRQWQGQLWGNLNITPFLQAGLAYGGSYYNIDPGVNSRAQDFNTRLTWRATQRITLSGMFGYELREFEHDGTPGMRSPHYSGSLSYTPLEGTTLIASVSRTISPSLLLNTLSRNDSQQIEFRQRVFKVCDFGLSYSHMKSEYLYFDRVARDDRTDRFGVTFDVPVTRHGVFELSYTGLRNNSSQSLFRRNSKTFGLNLRFNF